MARPEAEPALFPRVWGAVSRPAGAAALCGALMLTGCGTQYGKLTLTGGYIDKMIEPDIGLVAVGGNGFTAPDKIRSIVMLRAAELTIEQGYQRFSLFTVVDEATQEAQRAGRLGDHLRDKANRNDGPSVITERTTVSSRWTGPVGIDKSSAGVYVLMFKGSGRGAYDARTIAAELTPKLVEPPVDPGRNPRPGE